ncbi:FG-GAP repeat domain-containing protein [Hymenobacter nivis]|uniref:VCBS repeat-containing protein n=1 Tax=Hymenobacter nivis TaxID=1850093 RepID=A0A502GYN3_9BACT|nr:VCBS repeat-containing protein [Hymenobacter nivis]TPG67517.1 VCBS repeat-containing protein [Hymenobacter nivis]
MLSSATSSFSTALRRTLLAGLALGLPAAAGAQTISGFSPAQAAAGATVTISGTGLNNLKSVTINGQTMKVATTRLVAGIGSVDVVVPRAAATGRMRLTTAAGTALTATKLGITRVSSDVKYGAQTAPVGVATATSNYSTPTMGDLDNDGLVDMMLGQGDGTIRFYEQSAANSASFATTTNPVLLKNADTNSTTLHVSDINSANTNYAKPTLTDLDGNGLLELLVGEETGRVIRYEQVAATGADALRFTRTVLFVNPYNTASATATASAPNAGSYARPTVADLDNDGLLDVLVGSNDGTLRRYEQTVPNALTFNDLNRMKLADGTNIDAGSVDKPLLTDYNGDGYLDMLLGNQAGTIVLYTQSAANSAVFRPLNTLTTDGTTAISTATLNGYAAPAITDIDGDGLLDLYVGNANGTVLRYEQTQSAAAPALAAGALTTPAPLPVTLTAFTGQAAARANVLHWATASEKNSARFVIERATGAEFAAVGSVAAAGSSSSALSYEFADATALAAGTTYYRLRQEDLDGTVAYSPVMAVVRAAGALGAPVATAYPSIFAETLSVVLPGAAANQSATIALLTLDGRPVYSRALELGPTPLVLAGLPTLAPGLYLLRTTTAAGTTTQRLSHN